MTIPFTADQFLSVFEQYNRAIEPAPFAAYAFGAVALVLAWRGGRGAGRFVLGVLALFWAVSGAGYHLAFFRRINPAAIAFGILFLVQAALLAHAAVRREPLAFRFRLTARHVAAVTLAVYALVAYARVAAAVGHGYPRAPVFGVAPCPTTIFTIAVLLLAEARPPATLLAIPFAWSLVGVSAAVELGMHEDYGLGVAGLVALVAVVLGRRYERAARAPRANVVARGSRAV